MTSTLNSLYLKTLIARLKLVILSPKDAWKTIAHDQDAPIQILTKTLLPLVCASIVANVAGLQVFGQHVPFFGVWRPGLFSSLINQILIGVTTISVFFIDALVIEKLAPHFRRAISYDKAFSVVAHSSLPGFLVGIVGIFPQLSTIILVSLVAALYSFLLFFYGLEEMAPSESAASEGSRYTFFGVALGSVIALNAIVHFLIPTIAPTPFPDVGRLN